MGTLANREDPDEMPQKAAFFKSNLKGQEKHIILKFQLVTPLNVQWNIQARL